MRMYVSATETECMWTCMRTHVGDHVSLREDMCESVYKVCEHSSEYTRM